VDIAGLKKAIVSFAESRRDDWTAIAKHLHRHPETGLQEHESSAYLASTLEREGFSVDRGVAGMPTAFKAFYGAEKPSIAILAEMDALPGLGHACGHNIIAAAAVGAAITLRHVLLPSAARIVVMGTPAEEQGVGKIEMVKAGCFADVDFAMMVHPSSKRQVMKMYLGLAKIRFTFLGKAAHAAAHPEEGVNALDAVLQMFNGVNALRQQLRQDVRVHGIITDGGVAPNIIPEKASCFFYVRAEDLQEVEAVKYLVIRCAEGAAVATGCRVDIQEDKRVLAPLNINKSFYRVYSDQLKYLQLQEANAPIDRNRGSSDIGNVSQVVPTIHPHVPIGEGLHIHTADFAEATVSEKGKEAVVEGVTAMALTAAELVASPELSQKIMKEFLNSLSK